MSAPRRRAEENLTDVAQNPRGGPPDDVRSFPANPDPDRSAFLLPGLLTEGLRIPKDLEGQREEIGNLFTVDLERIRKGDDPDDRRDEEVRRVGGGIVHLPQDVHILETDAHLFVGLPQGRGDGIRIFRVPSPTRKGDLSSVRLEMVRPLDEEDLKLAFGLIERDQNRRPLSSLGRQEPSLAPYDNPPDLISFDHRCLVNHAVVKCMARSRSAGLVSRWCAPGRISSALGSLAHSYSARAGEEESN